MKQKLRLFTIHQTVASLQQTNILNPSNIWYPALDESNRMEYAYFIIHQGEILLLKMVANWNPFFKKSTGFTSSTFPIQPDFSQNQPAVITLKYQFSPDIAGGATVQSLHINIISVTNSILLSLMHI